MHIGGEGSVEKLADGVKAALAKMKEIRSANPQPAKSFGGGIPEQNAISAAPLAASFTATPSGWYVIVVAGRPGARRSKQAMLTRRFRSKLERTFCNMILPCFVCE